MNIKEITKKTGINQSDENNKITSIIKGIIISLIITILSLVIFSMILANTNIGEDTIMPTTTIITGISILVGSIISVLKIKKNGILNGAIVGLIYIITIYILSSIVNGEFTVNLNSLILIIVTIISGMVGGIIGVNIKK